MKAHRLRTTIDKVGVAAVIWFQLLCNGWASNYQVLYSFTGGNDGGGAYAGVALDKKGNLYGTTSGGGVYGYGTVYKVKHRSDGSWTEKVLHSFQHGGPDGDEPISTPIFDLEGNLYATTPSGGAFHEGTVFEMTPNRSGWAFNVIYAFCGQPNCSDGGVPWAGVVIDSAGNLYGTAFNVFELSPGLDGWTETVLHDFCAQPCNDGYQPLGVILDTDGNLYGTTDDGGAHGAGIVFKLMRMRDGSWSERLLHSFPAFSDDGRAPLGPLVFDSQGSLYGTTGDGGKNICYSSHCGTIFRLTRQPDGHWKETILHHFRQGKNGYWPGPGGAMDGAGNLYGTAAYGGTDCDCGVIYKLSPNQDGTWTYSVLHRFTGYDGAEPGANMILDGQGNLYGTTVTGGPGGYGVVFKIAP